jgi:hypothetical protein
MMLQMTTSYPNNGSCLLEAGDQLLLLEKPEAARSYFQRAMMYPACALRAMIGIYSVQRTRIPYGVQCTTYTYTIRRTVYNVQRTVCSVQRIAYGVQRTAHSVLHCPDLIALFGSIFVLSTGSCSLIFTKPLNRGID